jgi:chemotaxis protein histidine kinase CheA
MLLRNLFLVLFFIGMVFSLPIDEESKDVENIEGDVKGDVVEHFIDATKNDEVAVEEPKNTEEEAKEEEKEQQEVEKKEEPKTEEKEEPKTEEKEEPKTEEKEEPKTEEKEQPKTETEEDPTPTAREEPVPTEVVPFIPENEEIAVQYEDSCTKDHILLGNHVPSDVCKDLYKACTTKELLAIIVYYYSKQAPVSIEYTINEGINKQSISESCGSILVNSKIFQKETVIIPPVDEIEIEPVEKIKKLTQDLPKEDIENIKRDEQNREGDEFAEYSEDQIEE